MTTLTVPVHGMSCGGCTSSVTRVLGAMPGVSDVEVTLEPPQARLAIRPEVVSPEQVVKAIEGAGFVVPGDWRPAASGA